jgi:hypothetical protein
MAITSYQYTNKAFLETARALTGSIPSPADSAFACDYGSTGKQYYCRKHKVWI